MWVRVYRLRKEGVRLPNDQLGPATLGVLMLRRSHYGSRDHALRTVVATLRKDRSALGPGLLPELWNALAVDCNDVGLLFVGRERVHPHAPNWRQAWWCEFAQPPGRSQAVARSRQPAVSRQAVPALDCA